MNETYYWVYILNCENNTLYTGYTTDLIRRYQEHIEAANANIHMCNILENHKEYLLFSFFL